ncbi:MAG: cyclic nucleotide-binding domain-containing protein [Pseudomonadota bacterium]
MVFVMVGSLTSNSVAADKAAVLTLSDALSQVTLFTGLTDAERGALQSAATLRRGLAGERIIQQGTALDTMFIILEGPAEVRINGKPFVTLTGQTLVGEVEFLDPLSASADVVLLKETNLIALNFAALSELMEKRPRLGFVIMSELARIEARRLRATNPK